MTQGSNRSAGAQMPVNSDASPQRTAAGAAAATMPVDRSDSPSVSQQELAETVARMEARLGAHGSAQVQALFTKYRALVRRFEADLAPSARDVALARASVLMLVQEVARDEAAGSPLARHAHASIRVGAGRTKP